MQGREPVICRAWLLQAPDILGVFSKEGCAGLKRRSQHTAAQQTLFYNHHFTNEPKRKNSREKDLGQGRFTRQSPCLCSMQLLQKAFTQASL